MKMPDPMMPPMTTMVASNGPSARRKVTRALYPTPRSSRPRPRVWYHHWMPSRLHAPYMHWAKTRPEARFDLAGSNVLACDIDDLEGARDVLTLTGRNDNGFEPLVDAIAKHYKVDPACVATAGGAAGANFQACAAAID